MKSCIGLQVPQGATPRSIHIQLKGEVTRTVKPGDSVTVTGIYLAEPYTGFRAMKAGLLTNTYMEAMHIEHNKQSYADLQLSTDKDAFLAVQFLLAYSALSLQCLANAKLHGTQTHTRLSIVICNADDMLYAALLLAVACTSRMRFL